MAVKIIINDAEINAQYKQLRQQVSKLASMANKRLRRMEQAGFQESPAYKQWIESGGEYFSVKGKTYNELQSELARVREFTEKKTSTITGAKKVLTEIQKNTGLAISGETMGEQLSNFFELASQIEQYLRVTEQTASAIGYQKIWEAINTYIKDENSNLLESGENMEDAILSIAKMIGYEGAVQILDNSTDTSGYIII